MERTQEHIDNLRASIKDFHTAEYKITMTNGQTFKFEGTQAELAKHLSVPKRSISTSVIGRRSTPLSADVKRVEYFDELEQAKRSAFKMPLPKAKVFSPTGEEFYPDNLRQFCKQKGICYHTMLLIFHGKRKRKFDYKGWRIMRADG